MQQTVSELTTQPKKDSFRKYLDDSGVIDSLTRAIVTLYDQTKLPNDIPDFFKQFLGSPQGVNIESLKNENAKLKEEKEKLEKRLQELKTQLGITE